MTFKNTNNSFTTKFENSTTLQKVAELSGKLPFSDRLLSILNFEQLKHFQWSSSFHITCKVFEIENSHSPPQSGSVLQRKFGGNVSIQIRIKLTFTGLHFYKHWLALTKTFYIVKKTTKMKRIVEYSLLAFQCFSLNRIYNFFRCITNNKVSTILPIVATCSSYKNFCVVKLYKKNKQT